MPLATIFPPAILETILTRLAALFLAGAAGDSTAARQAAAQMLASYHPETEDEIRLAANIILFSFQAMEALSQAATPDIPVTRVMKLRSGAVSLSRQSQKAEQRLEQLQNARQQGQSAPAPSVEPEPQVETAQALIEDTNTVAAVAKARNLTWSQAYEDSQREARIAAGMQKREARLAAQAAAAMNPNPSPPNQAAA
jgi:hypothetical protein